MVFKVVKVYIKHGPRPTYYLKSENLTNDIPSINIRFEPHENLLDGGVDIDEGDIIFIKMLKVKKDEINEKHI